LRIGVGPQTVLNQTDDELRQSLIDSDSRLALPDGRTDASVDAETVRERVADRLANNPAASWREVNEEVAEQLTDEQEDYSDTVEAAVKELLDEHDVVTVSPLSGES
jgi:type II secretory pathway predicted ATPase ExeA